MKTEKVIKKVFPGGTIEYKNSNGQLHRADGPAFIYADGAQSWWVNGQRHRTDGPAFIWADGTQAWYLNGQLHRTDGPAYIWADGTQAWYLNDKQHRTDGPAVIRADGSQEWCLNDKKVDGKKFEFFRTCPMTELPLHLNETDYLDIILPRLRAE